MPEHTIDSIRTDMDLDADEYHVLVDETDGWHEPLFADDVSDEWNDGIFEADAILIDADDLDDFITAVGGVDAIPQDVGVYADDETTRGTNECYIVDVGYDYPEGLDADDSEQYGLITEVHRPWRDAEILVDFRRRV